LEDGGTKGKLEEGVDKSDGGYRGSIKKGAEKASSGRLNY